LVIEKASSVLTKSKSELIAYDAAIKCIRDNTAGLDYQYDKEKGIKIGEDN
jgi:hypothetical protein